MVFIRRLRSMGLSLVLFLLVLILRINRVLIGCGRVGRGSISSGMSLLTLVSSRCCQGFGAASGVASGLGGLVSMGSGLRNIGAEPRLSGRWLRRGIGRTTAGAGQVFAGMAAAGKGISAMTGATTAGAQFMTAAALPASISMGGVDVLKGG